MSERYKIDVLFVDYSMLNKRTGTIPNLWSDTKVSELKQRIKDKEGVEGVRLVYGSKQLEKDEATLADYGLYNEATIFAILRLKGGSQDPSVNTKTYKARNMDPDLKSKLAPKLKIEKTIKCESAKAYAPKYDSCEEDSYYCAEMSCGHSWCAGCVYEYLDKGVNINGDSQIKCPISNCMKAWQLNETFVAANISDKNERAQFNKKMNKYGMRENGFSICPQEKCQTFIFRGEELKGRNDVKCPQCNFMFCYMCKEKWSNANICKNEKCGGSAQLVKKLVNCGTKNISGVKDVPTLRQCPNPDCRSLNEHKGGCKRMECPRCDHMYCHICTRRWIGNPKTCDCHYCNSLGESAPEGCGYAFTCTIVQN